jgi:fido (protein-threonine AMPylation protein)
MGEAQLSLLLDIQSANLPADTVVRDTRPIHLRLFRDLAPPGHEYYAGNYRGSHQKCLRKYEVRIVDSATGKVVDDQVGAPADTVLVEMAKFGSAIASAVSDLEAATFASDSDRIIAIVKVSCEAFVRFLTVHPFFDGNGHVARALLFIMLRQFGYSPVNWTVDPRPPFPTYSEMIYKHRRGDKAPLEQFMLGCIAPV